MRPVLEDGGRANERDEALLGGPLRLADVEQTRVLSSPVPRGPHLDVTLHRTPLRIATKRGDPHPHLLFNGEGADFTQVPSVAAPAKLVKLAQSMTHKSYAIDTNAD